MPNDEVHRILGKMCSISSLVGTWLWQVIEYTDVFVEMTVYVRAGGHGPSEQGAQGAKGEGAPLSASRAWAGGVPLSEQEGAGSGQGVGSCWRLSRGRGTSRERVANGLLTAGADKSEQRAVLGCRAWCKAVKTLTLRESQSASSGVDKRMFQTNSEEIDRCRINVGLQHKIKSRNNMICTCPECIQRHHVIYHGQQIPGRKVTPQLRRTHELKAAANRSSDYTKVNSHPVGIEETFDEAEDGKDKSGSSAGVCTTFS
ncbi:hypothetical protein DFH07DRAFT_783185 [Mycena maculata]|uniref:Uncharacterized protein n=1 Tax=Mycena maculata TaxID=230809 RepID=A0AAD7HNS2_9AGAR|nr:hypothetical protein DFH07DRAFT_783185 [Mycena maculata]